MLFFISDTYIQEIDLFFDISAYNNPYIIVYKRNYESLPLFSSIFMQVDTVHSKNSLIINMYVLLWNEEQRFP